MDGFGWNYRQYDVSGWGCFRTTVDTLQNGRLDILDRNLVNDAFFDQEFFKHLARFDQPLDHFIGIDQERYLAMPDREGMKLTMRIEHDVNVV